MLSGRLFLFSALLLFRVSGASASSDRLVLRGLIFPSVQISIVSDVSAEEKESNVSVESNMRPGTYKVYQLGRSLGPTKSKYRQLVVEAN